MYELCHIHVVCSYHVRLEIPYWFKTTTQILKVLAKLILEEFYIHFHLDGSLTLYVVWSRTWFRMQ